MADEFYHGNQDKTKAGIERDLYAFHNKQSFVVGFCPRGERCQNLNKKKLCGDFCLHYSNFKEKK